MRHRCRTLAVGDRHVVAVARCRSRACDRQRDPPSLPVVYTERAGLRLGTDRSPVASLATSHLRCASYRASPPRRARRCSREAGTARVPDGRYELELTRPRRGSTGASSCATTRRSRPRRSRTRPPGSIGAYRSVVGARGVRAASYRPGELARFASACVPVARRQVLHAGPSGATRATTRCGVSSSTAPFACAMRARSGSEWDWESGLYTARLQAGHRVGFAPFVVRPRRLGEPRRRRPADEHLAGLQLPVHQRRRPSRHLVLLVLVHVRRHVPAVPRPRRAPAFPCVRPRLPALAGDPRQARAHAGPGGSRAALRDHLARLYDLIVFPGHHEYATPPSTTPPALPRPRRQPRVPLGEQLLLPRRPHATASPGSRAGATSAVPKLRSSASSTSTGTSAATARGSTP